MFSLFVEGGVIYMTILTLMFIALFLAAWKAPAWVKEIGKMAAVFGVIAFLVNFTIGAKEIARVGDVAQSIVWGAFSMAMIPIAYGLIIYLISLIIRIVQKPRI